ncbi:hypothetical protein D3C75_729040 [compost metagenome]
MGLVTGLAKAMAFIGVVMRFDQDAVVLQCRDHVAGLLRDDHGIQFSLKEDHRHADVAGMQQRRAGGVAFGIQLRIADQPIQIVAFEFVGRAPQRHRVADPIQAGAGAEHVVKGQGAKAGVAAGAAAANERLVAVDQASLLEVTDHGAGVLHINITPAQVQCLAIGPAVTAAAAIVEIGHGEAPLCPVLDTRIEHRVTRRSRSAMDEHHQWRFRLAGHRRVEEAVCFA